MLQCTDFTDGRAVLIADDKPSPTVAEEAFAQRGSGLFGATLAVYSTAVGTCITKLSHTAFSLLCSIYDRASLPRKKPHSGFAR